MDNQDQIKQQQEKYLTEALERGGAFEQITSEKGWELLMANYKNNLAQFINDLMNSDEPIESFEMKRQQLKGIKTFLGAVDSDLATLKGYRDEQENSNK